MAGEVLLRASSAMASGPEISFLSSQLRIEISGPGSACAPADARRCLATAVLRSVRMKSVVVRA